MALDQFAAYILAKYVKISPIFESKTAQNKWTPERAKNDFFLSLNLLRFPPKKGKMCCFSYEKVGSKLV